MSYKAGSASHSGMACSSPHAFAAEATCSAGTEASQWLQAERTGSNAQASTATAEPAPKPRVYSQEETAYSQHQWNINNLPRCKVWHCPRCCICLLPKLLCSVVC